MLFCDDSSRFESLYQLTERHTELAARRQQLQAKLDSANRVGAVLVNNVTLHLLSKQNGTSKNALLQKQTAHQR